MLVPPMGCHVVSPHEQNVAYPAFGSPSEVTSGTSRHDTVPSAELSGHDEFPV